MLPGATREQRRSPDERLRSAATPGGRIWKAWRSQPRRAFAVAVAYALMMAVAAAAASGDGVVLWRRQRRHHPAHHGVCTCGRRKAHRAPGQAVSEDRTVFCAGTARERGCGCTAALDFINLGVIVR